MNFVIQSGEHLPYDLIKMIMDILGEAHCPWEVFKTTVPNYKSFDGKTIQIGDGDNFQINIVCKALFKEDELQGL